MKGLGQLFRGTRRHEMAWEATQAEQGDTVLMPDWVPEEGDSELILLADIGEDAARA